MLAPGGRFLLLVNHPMFQGSGSGFVDDRILGERYWRVGPYLREDVVVEEVDPGVDSVSPTARCTRYVNPLAALGCVLTRLYEPEPPRSSSRARSTRNSKPRSRGCCCCVSNACGASRWEDERVAEYLILTGLSGAGRSTAAATIEDLGWFVIDNLPPALIGRVAELASESGAELERFCFVVGRGGYEGIAELAPEIRRLRSTGARVRLLFLDAPDEVLVRRFEGTRRRHPVEADTSCRPSSRSAPCSRCCATRRTSWSTRARRTAPVARSPRRAPRMGRLHRRDGDHDRVVRLQARAPARRRPRPRLPLPAQPALDRRAAAAHRSGPARPRLRAREPEAMRVPRSPGRPLRPACARLRHEEGKSYLSIAIGCTGGQHRSVVLAEEIAERIRQHGYAPMVHHRDIER